MAAGDITYTKSYPIRLGNSWLVRGTVEVDTTLRAFAITDAKSRMLSFQLENVDNVGTAPRVLLNQDASAVETYGSVALDGPNATDTFNFTATYI